MQIDSTPPHTNVAQAMGEVAQAPPPPKPSDVDTGVKATTPDGVGDKVDVTA